MTELALNASSLTFRLELDRLTRAAQRLMIWLGVLHILWSIAASSGLITGLVTRYFGISGAEANAGFWIVQQLALRTLLAINVAAAVAGAIQHREDTSGYTGRALTTLFGLFVLWLIAERVFVVTTTTPYILTLWGLQLVNGLIQGSLYALIALGYTLVYGILLMINFAHGDVMMMGSYFGYFALQAFAGNPAIYAPRGADPQSASVLATLFMMLVVVGVAMIGAAIVGLTVERVAYRPLRRAPRLVPLISAIGMSLFLQQTAQRIFGTVPRAFERPSLLTGTVALNLGQEFGPPIPISVIGIIVLSSAFALMFGLYSLVRRTKIGRAMRAVAEDKDTASLMGTNVNRVIAITFGLGAALAGAAGVMWGFYTGVTDAFTGFLPGIKAFTAAVLGGIGNIPGAVLGGLFLGLVEALGPFALGIPIDYQNVIAFSLLILVLLFRPTGLLGEVLAEKKV